MCFKAFSKNMSVQSWQAKYIKLCITKFTQVKALEFVIFKHVFIIDGIPSI
jgi:hypothetical protein